jgi:hypothetical protein
VSDERSRSWEAEIQPPVAPLIYLGEVSASPPACTLCPEPRAAHLPLLPGDGAGRYRCAVCGQLGRPHARLEGDPRGAIIYICGNRHHSVGALRHDRDRS